MASFWFLEGFGHAFDPGLICLLFPQVHGLPAHFFFFEVIIQISPGVSDAFPDYPSENYNPSLLPVPLPSLFSLFITV